MTAVSSAPARVAPPSFPATATVIGRAYVVVGVDGDDALAHRLVACGLWPGARLERLAQALFGDPVLFRVHGYRLALRAGEAARVRVAETPA